MSAGTLRSKKIVVKRKRVVPIVSFLGCTWYPDTLVDAGVTGYDICLQKANTLNHNLVIRCDSTVTGKSIYSSFENRNIFYECVSRINTVNDNLNGVSRTANVVNATGAANANVARNLSQFKFWEMFAPQRKHNLHCVLRFPQSMESQQLEIREACTSLLGKCVTHVLKGARWNPDRLVFKQFKCSRKTDASDDNNNASDDSDDYLKFLVIYPIQFTNSTEQNKFWKYVQYFLNTLFKFDDRLLRNQLMYFDESFHRKDMIQYPLDGPLAGDVHDAPRTHTAIHIDVLRQTNLVTDTLGSVIVEAVLDMTPNESEFKIPEKLNKHAVINYLRTARGLEIDPSVMLDTQIRDNFIMVDSCECKFIRNCHYDDYNAYQYIAISYEGALEYRCTAASCSKRTLTLGNGLFRDCSADDFPAVDVDHAKARADEWFANVDMGMNAKYSSFDALLVDILNRDDGLAEVFSDIYEDCIIITGGGSQVYLWNGMIWELDECHKLSRLVTKSMRAILKRMMVALNAQFDQFEDQKCDEAKQIRAKVNILLSLQDKVNSGITLNIVKAFSSNFYVTNFAQQQNFHPYKMIAKNGMINLKTGQIMDPLPEDNLTLLGEYKYYPCSCQLGECGKTGQRCDSECNLSFVETIIRMMQNDDEERYNHLRWIIGYCLTGDPKKKLAFFGYGEKYNGKSLLSNLLIDILPMYVKAMDKTVVIKARMTKAAGAASPELTHLNGIRLALLNETGEDDVVNEEQMKSITGRDKKTVRDVYGKKSYDMDMDFAPWIMSNFRPKMSLSDPAMWKRVCPVTFPVSFLTEPDPTNPFHRSADEDLNKKFHMFENKERFYNWAARCCFYYVQNQDKPFPQAIKDEISMYMRECNMVAEFVEEKPDRFAIEVNGITSLRDFMTTFKEWCRDRGIMQRPTNKKISEMLRNLKCDIKLDTNQIIGLKDLGDSRSTMINFSSGDIY